MSVTLRLANNRKFPSTHPGPGEFLAERSHRRGRPRRRPAKLHADEDYGAKARRQECRAEGSCFGSPEAGSKAARHSAASARSSNESRPGSSALDACPSPANDVPNQTSAVRHRQDRHDPRSQPHHPQPYQTGPSGVLTCPGSPACRQHRIQPPNSSDRAVAPRLTPCPVFLPTAP